jgi:uncharacterized membrane protein YhaH (DUF805 family)
MSGMVFCRECGGQIHSTAPICPKCGAPQRAAGAGGAGYSFRSAIALCFDRYVQFSGRAPRAEYWYFILFTLLVTFGAGFMDGVLLDGRAVFSTIANLVFFLPVLSVGVRRLHDLDRSGWWYWLIFIPFIGAIILLVWFVTKGTNEANRFGPDPLPA